MTSYLSKESGIILVAGTGCHREEDLRLLGGCIQHPYIEHAQPAPGVVMSTPDE